MHVGIGMVWPPAALVKLGAEMAEEPRAEKWSSEKQEFAKAWLRRKWGESHACPHCGNSDWEVGDSAASVFVTSPRNAMMIANGAYPCFVVMCSNCGYTALINSIISGMIPPQPQEAGNAGTEG